MSKHTPGPWELGPYGQVTDTNGRTVLMSGFATPMVSTAESIANARLASAAPDMLGALKRMLELCLHANRGAFENGVTDSTGTIDEGDVIAARIMDEASKAIAKAEGQS